VGPAAEDRFGTCTIDRAEEPAEWATVVAGRLAEPLQRAAERSGLPDSASARRNRPDPEPERQRALDELGLIGRDPDPRLTDIVELARTVLGTECAEINFIDRDRQWKMAVAGSEREDVRREESFCNLTIQRAEPTVIEDARLDPLLRLSPAVTGSRHVRFYAAYPLESPAGYRIGTLCVYDSEPRDAAGLNLALLRDLALLAQGELSGVDERPAGEGVPLVSR
jgi:GAF domain-containing protein